MNQTVLKMASTSSRPDSPEVDFSVIRTSIDMGHKMIDQILYGIHYGSDEVRHLLREECDFVLECKVCRNLFRSFPNFVAHKRVYCIDSHADKTILDQFQPTVTEEEVVIVQPEAPDDTNKQSKQPSMPSGPSVLEKVIKNNYQGKSKEFQFYNKVAEDVERKKAAQTTSRITLTSMPSSHAVQVQQTIGGSPVKQSNATSSNTSPKKSSPEKNKEKSSERPSTSGPPVKKNLMASVSDLLKKQLEKGKEPSSTTTGPKPVRFSTRARKSSPRKSIDYMEKSKDKDKNQQEEESMEVDVATVEKHVEKSIKAIELVDDKSLKELCDTKARKCRVCFKTFRKSDEMLLHVKTNHSKSIFQRACPCCKNKFDNFASLAKHLKGAHNKSDAYIRDMKVKLVKQKTDSGKVNNSPVQSSKESESRQPYKVTWRQCAKCDKYFCNQTKLRKHIQKCKGPVSARSVKKAPTNPEAFMKLEEKLRAGLIQTIYPEDCRNKGKETDREKNSGNVKGTAIDTDKNSGRNVKDKEIQNDKNTGLVETTYPELLKTLTGKATVSAHEKQIEKNIAMKSPELKNMKNVEVVLEKLNSPTNKGSENKTEDHHLKTKTTIEPDAAKTKTYNLRVGGSSREQVKSQTEVAVKDATAVKIFPALPVTPDKDVSKVTKEVTLGSPALKELKERLVREAGLDEPDATSITEIEVKATVCSFSTTSNKNTAAGVRTRTISSDGESPGIKELMDKLTREALKPKPLANRDIETATGESQSRVVEDNTENVKIRRSSRMSSLERKTEKVADKSIEGTSTITASPVRSSSLESIGLKSPRRHSGDRNLPSSPTPSTQSTESYNMKFKMTVQEMAELVESASLTKFAKDRKKRASSILNKKQIKDAQKINPSLSRPMKRRVQKRNIIIRKPYGTRHTGRLSPKPRPGSTSTANSTSSEQTTTILTENEANLKKLSREQRRLMNSAGFVEENFYASTSGLKERHVDSDSESRTSSLERVPNKRLSSTPKEGVGKSLNYESDSAESSNSNRTTARRPRQSLENLYKTASEVVARPDLTADSDKRKSTLPELSREARRLMNTAGFVEDNFYASTSGLKERTVDSDSESRTSSLERVPNKRLISTSKEGVTKSLNYESDSAESNKSNITAARRPRQSLENLYKTASEVVARPDLSADSDRKKSTYTELVNKDKTPSRETDSDKSDKNITTAQKVLDSKYSLRGLSDTNVVLRRTPNDNPGNTFLGKEASNVKVAEKSDVKGAEKSYVKVTEKSDVKVTEKSDAKVTEKPDVKVPEKSNVKVTEKSNVKVAEKSNIKVVGKSNVKVAEKSVVKVAENSNVKVTEKSNVVKAENSNVKVAEKPASNVEVTEKSNVMAAEKPIPKDTHTGKLAVTDSNSEKGIARLQLTNIKTLSDTIVKPANTNDDTVTVKNVVELTGANSEVKIIKIGQTESSDSRHRTRLSTGSIYFDSELLKTSPKKVETSPKKIENIDQQKKARSVDKPIILSSRIPQPDLSSLNPSGVAKVDLSSRLAAANDKLKHGHQRTTSAPQVFSIDKGVHKCSSCNKVFWKTGTYKKHLQLRTKCRNQSSEKIAKKTGMKRALSTTPDAKQKNIESQNSDESLGSRSKRSKGMDTAEESVNEVVKENSTCKQLDKSSKSEEKSKIGSKPVKSSNELTEQRKAESEPVKTSCETIDQNKKMTIVIVGKPHVDTSKSGGDGSSNESAEQNTSVDEVDALNVTGHADWTKNHNKYSSKRPMRTTSNTDDKTPKKSELKKDDQKCFVIEMDSRTAGEKAEQVAGPSHSGTSIVSASDYNSDDDDNMSDFSGFSEDDLKTSELELSQIELDTEDHEDSMDHTHVGDADLESMCNIDGPSDNVKQPTTSRRPVRKSALNRFSHIQEIYDCKDVRRPMVEKPKKSVKYREIVVDPKNPNKFQHHNYSEVDRLIDEAHMKCKQCDTPCSSMSNLRRHVIRHLGWKRYKCKLCRYTCYDMSNCRQHTARFHDTKLTSSNFDKFMTDLKREANSRRATKRWKTLRKMRGQTSDDETKVNSSQEKTLTLKNSSSPTSSSSDDDDDDAEDDDDDNDSEDDDIEDKDGVEYESEQSSSPIFPGKS